MKRIKTITRKDYMNNSSELHHEYYSQFVTESTKRYILLDLSVDSIKKALDSGDKHLNEIKIPFNNMGSGGDWWWDYSPMNIELARELGCVGQNSLPSPSTRTCVGKAAARILVDELKGKK